MSSSVTSSGPSPEIKEAPDRPVDLPSIETKTEPLTISDPSSDSGDEDVDEIEQDQAAPEQEQDPDFYYIRPHIRVLRAGAPVKIKGRVENNVVVVGEETWRENPLPGTRQVGHHLLYAKGESIPLSTVQRVE